MGFLNVVYELWENRILISALGAWGIAQVIKALLYGVLNGNFSLERLFGDGGMPSGHSATVSAAATAAAINCGLGSTEFAITVIIALIVMHDACGVRREAGKQARVIQDLVATLNILAEKEYTPPQKLKIFVGHTPMQVVVGSFVGILTGLFIGIL
jgi:acid phosphatase family membrane protein YuiD